MSEPSNDAALTKSKGAASISSICAFCRKPGADWKCGGCKRVVYCDRKCQKLHWDQTGGNHKAYTASPY